MGPSYNILGIPPFIKGWFCDHRPKSPTTIQTRGYWIENKLLQCKKRRVRGLPLGK
jgi:hypothetical protein